MSLFIYFHFSFYYYYINSITFYKKKYLGNKNLSVNLRFVLNFNLKSFKKIELIFIIICFSTEQCKSYYVMFYLYNVTCF